MKGNSKSYSFIINQKIKTDLRNSQYTKLNRKKSTQSLLESFVE
jgi:hypothetical protein